MKVLPVIPDDEVRISVYRNLLVLGHAVFEAKSTEEVGTGGKKELVDFIVLSLALPLYRGQDLVRLVKIRWPNVKIIVLFKGGDEGRQRLAKAAGADLLLAESAAYNIHSVKELREAINSLFLKP